MKPLFVFLMITFLLPVWGNSSIKGQEENVDSIVKTIPAEEFNNLIAAGDNIILLDVRTPEEVAAGYIANASNIDYNAPDFEEKINLLSKEKDIYVYCRSGRRSLNATEILRKNGFRHIFNLGGGIIGWEEKGFPITGKKEPNL